MLAMSPEAMKSKAAAPASAMKAIMKETMQASKKTEVKAKVSKAAAPAPAMTAAMKAMKSAKDKSSKGKSNKSCSKGGGHSARSGTRKPGVRLSDVCQTPLGLRNLKLRARGRPVSLNCAPAGAQFV